jgi:hypothetical protein
MASIFETLFPGKYRSFPTDRDRVAYAAALLRVDVETARTREERDDAVSDVTWKQFKTWLYNEMEDPKNRGWTAAIRLD